MITISTKVSDAKCREYIRAYNALFQKTTRMLFLAMYRDGMSRNEAKSYFIAKYQISAREFNSVYNQLDAQIKSRAELTKIHIDELKHNVATIKKEISRKEKKITSSQSKLASIATFKSKIRTWRQHKKGRKPKEPRLIKRLDVGLINKDIDTCKNWIASKEKRLLKLEKNLAQSQKELVRPKLCFGGASFFKKQYHLQANGFSCHDEWKAQWKWRRSRESFFVGSKDESCGNQNAQYKDGQLQLRVPKALRAKFGEYVYVPTGESFDALGEALSRNTAISYRFVEKEDVSRSGKPLGTRTLFCYASYQLPEAKMHKGMGGVIGVDINADHLAACLMDLKGNPVLGKSYYFNMKGLSTHQIEAILGDYIADIVEWAEKIDCTIAIEALDFRQKKKSLRERQGKGMRSVLSQFTYAKFHTMMVSRSARQGVMLKSENPAWTSLMGKVKFSGYSHMLTSHEMAALAIARRSMRMSERPKARRCLTSQDLMREALNDFCLADWTQSNRIKHIWSFWSRHKKPLRGVGLTRKIIHKEWEVKTMLQSRHPSGFKAQGDFVDSAASVVHSRGYSGGKPLPERREIPVALAVRAAYCTSQYRRA